VRRNDA